MSSGGYPASHVRLAVPMRGEPTPAEKVLWRSLRARQTGVKWRRQAPIGPFIVDFFCPQAHLIVEVDGATHADDADRDRDAWIRARGYRVLRFWNNEVLGNPDGVLRLISDTAAGGPPPPPGKPP